MEEILRDSTAQASFNFLADHATQSPICVLSTTRILCIIEIQRQILEFVLLLLG